ncbi:MAG: dioxygenase [Pseudomonadota bacterium]|nr:dioxygenase [Pseudomonadota bacterium]
MKEAQPALYIPHGGGPCFFMDWDPPSTWKNMEVWLRGLAGTLPVRPRAIVVVSAHWEEEAFTVTAHPAPSLIYDYYGFPAHTYEIQYPAPGAPEVARRVAEILTAAHLPVTLDAQRGFDHGVFVPFKLIYPEADIPIIQLSLKAGLDAALHIAAGEALAELRQDNILIVGSGMSYHNLREFFKGGADAKTTSDQFGAWLDGIVAAEPIARSAALSQWQYAPGARQAHPREEHLIPLMVVSGAARNIGGQRIFSDRVMGALVSGYQFG